MDVDEGSGQIVYTSSCDLGIYRICEQQMIRRVCTFCTVSPEPPLIAPQRWDVDEGSGQIVDTSSCDLGIYRICQFMWFRYLSHMRAANDQASLHILHSLARAFADCTTKMGCRWRLRPNCLYQFMWFRYLLHMRAANDQASLHILHSLARAFADCTKKMDEDEGSGQIVYTSSCDLGIYRICEQQMIRRACTFCTVSPEPSLIVLKGWM